MYKMTLNRVHDTVKISEGADSLKLRVEGDAGRMVAGISEAVKTIKNLTTESTDEEQRGAAHYFASVIFGDEQAGRLLDFYHGDAKCVIAICAQYLDGQLKKLIARAQKKGAGRK